MQPAEYSKKLNWLFLASTLVVVEEDALISTQKMNDTDMLATINN